MADKLKLVTVVSQEEFDEGPFNFDGTLDEVMANLAAIREMIPEGFRADARCEISSKGGYESSHYATIEVSYYRPMTRDELAQEEAALQFQRQYREACEREQFEALKKKFEGA